MSNPESKKRLGMIDTITPAVDALLRQQWNMEVAEGIVPGDEEDEASIHEVMSKGFLTGFVIIGEYEQMDDPDQESVTMISKSRISTAHMMGIISSADKSM